MLVSGTTESRLAEILPLGKEPTVGEDGVLHVGEGQVRYRIGSILYEDKNGATVFFYRPDRPYEKDLPFIALPFDAQYLDIDATRLNIQRPGVPAFQTIFNLDYLEDSDLTAFPQNFF